MKHGVSQGPESEKALEAMGLGQADGWETGDGVDGTDSHSLRLPQWVTGKTEPSATCKPVPNGLGGQFELYFIGKEEP